MYPDEFEVLVGLAPPGRNFVAEMGEDDFSRRFRIPAGRESSRFFRMGRMVVVEGSVEVVAASGNFTSGELRPT